MILWIHFPLTDKVHLEVINDVPHGFLNFIDFNENAKKESYRCLPHIEKILC